MKTIISIIFFILAIVYIFNSIDFTLLTQYISSFSYSSILFLIIFNIISLYLMAYRFIILFNKISLFNSFKINTISMGINQVTPARTGDVVKPFMLKKLTNRKASYFFAIVIIERLLDVALLGVLAILLIPIQKVYIISLLIISLVMIFILNGKNIKKTIHFIKYIKNKKIRNFILKLYITLVKFEIKVLIKALIITAIMYVIYLLTMHIFINSFTSFNLDFMNTVTVFIFTVFGLMIPSAPASLGTYEASMVFSLGLFDISKEEALSFAVLYHFIQIGTILFLSGVFMIWKRYE